MEHASLPRTDLDSVARLFGQLSLLEPHRADSLVYPRFGAKFKKLAQEIDKFLIKTALLVRCLVHLFACYTLLGLAYVEFA